MQNTKSAHKWRFYRYGGLEQVSIETADDLRYLGQLDPKLWAVMTCPTTNIDFDARTLEYIDSDKDGRIKIFEVIAAVRWICSVLNNPADILNPQEALPLSAINADTDEGKSLIASARMVMANLGKPEVSGITFEDLADTRKIFSATQSNGDGIMTADMPDNKNAGKLIEDVIACFGSVVDRSGKPGINQDLLDQFMKAVTDFSAWKQAGERDGNNILFAGPETGKMAAIYTSVKAKIDDYYARCHLAEFDRQYATAAVALEHDYVVLLHKNLSDYPDELKQLPLSLTVNCEELPLLKKVNPAWAALLAEFAEKVAKPLIGTAEKISEAQWLTIKSKFAPYEAWQKAMTGTEVEELGEQRMAEILSSSASKEIAAMISKDLQRAPEFEAIMTVDKLLHYYRYLHKLLNNFVALRDFYDTTRSAIFQIGVLFMDSRSCNLCVKVDDIAKHSAMAISCNIYMVYCECVRRDTSEKMMIAVGFTDGASDQLVVGRNGLFVDHRSNYWDATIVKVIDHPISIRQAFWKPYQRIGAFIQEQVEKFAAAKDKQVGDNLSKSVEEKVATVAAADKKTAPTTAFDVGKFAGIFAAIGLAFAAIGSTVTSIIAGFMGLDIWQMPLVVIGALLIISGPSMLITALRLRRRNLGAILDANGWAVNTRAQINLAFGHTLTSMAKFPAGAIRSSNDPFADKKRPWILYVLFALLIGFVIMLYQAPADCSTKLFLQNYFNCSPKTAIPAKAGPASATAELKKPGNSIPSAP